jgi:hypothetical protein
MQLRPVVLLLVAFFVSDSAATAESRIVFSGEQRRNNLVAELLEVASITPPGSSFTFKRRNAGYIFVTADCRGEGTVTLKLDDAPELLAVIQNDAETPKRTEAVRIVSPGEHKLSVASVGEIRVEKLVVKAIPELIHCGLDFNPAIKSYGKYDLAFLKRDILPNVTTLIVPPNAHLDQAFIDDWHRQGKRLVAAVGINPQAKTADENARYWSDFFEKAPFWDGIIIDEFIVNRPYREWITHLTPERKRRFDNERALHPIYEQAFRKIRADRRYRDKMVYAYIGEAATR